MKTGRLFRRRRTLPAASRPTLTLRMPKYERTTSIGAAAGAAGAVSILRVDLIVVPSAAGLGAYAVAGAAAVGLGLGLGPSRETVRL